MKWSMHYNIWAPPQLTSQWLLCQVWSDCWWAVTLVSSYRTNWWMRLSWAPLSTGVSSSQHSAGEGTSPCWRKTPALVEWLHDHGLPTVFQKQAVFFLERNVLAGGGTGFGLTLPAVACWSYPKGVISVGFISHLWLSSASLTLPSSKSPPGLWTCWSLQGSLSNSRNIAWVQDVLWSYRKGDDSLVRAQAKERWMQTAEESCPRSYSEFGTHQRPRGKQDPFVHLPFHLSLLFIWGGDWTLQTETWT